MPSLLPIDVHRDKMVINRSQLAHAVHSHKVHMLHLKTTHNLSAAPLKLEHHIFEAVDWYAPHCYTLN